MIPRRLSTKAAIISTYNNTIVIIATVANTGKKIAYTATIPNTKTNGTHINDNICAINIFPIPDFAF